MHFLCVQIDRHMEAAYNYLVGSVWFGQALMCVHSFICACQRALAHNTHTHFTRRQIKGTVKEIIRSICIQHKQLQTDRIQLDLLFGCQRFRNQVGKTNARTHVLAIGCQFGKPVSYFLSIHTQTLYSIECLLCYFFSFHLILLVLTLLLFSSLYAFLVSCVYIPINHSFLCYI